ncbi:MAG: type II toxin-antitoxin system YafQ family toxin [Clostridiales Family XIII bacterium]|jgi:mRNA interferase YafQ|nr:type II toxin-antitoxin system YafQ family toxin [Clostridiales Family XIII bacterium]
MLRLILKDKFCRDVKKLEKKHFDMAKLWKCVDYLLNRQLLLNSYKPHPLKGKWDGFMECHIEENILLVYYTDDGKLHLVRLGSHDDLF